MGMTDALVPQDFITALCNLQKACGVDNLSMAEAGITKDELDTIATLHIRILQNLHAIFV